MLCTAFSASLTTQELPIDLGHQKWLALRGPAVVRQACGHHWRAAVWRDRAAGARCRVDSRRRARRAPGRRAPARGDRRGSHRVLHRSGQSHPDAPERQILATVPLDPRDSSDRSGARSAASASSCSTWVNAACAWFYGSVALATGRPAKRAFASKVRIVRSVCAACAAMIRSWAPRGVLARRTCAISRAWQAAVVSV